MGRPIKSHNSDTFCLVAILLIVSYICFYNPGTKALIPDASAQDIPDSADVFFDLNGYSVQPGGDSLLREQIALLKNSPDMIIVIEGYSDITGEDEYNLSLSRRRAESVRNYLINQGIEPERVRAQGNGKTDKFAEGLGEESLKQNRRVRIIFDMARTETPTPAPEEKKDAPSLEIPEPALEGDPEENIAEINPGPETYEEPLPPAVAEPGAPPLELSTAIESSMRKLAPGRIVFETPERMSVGETYIIEADLSYSFVRDLSKSLNSASPRDVNRMRLGQGVGVHLSGHGFDIKPVTEADRSGGAEEEIPVEGAGVIKTVEENSTAKWLWHVTPLKSGFRSLLLSVEVIVEDSRYNEMVNEYPIFQKLVEVKSSFLHSVTSSYWIMVVFIIIVIAAVGWVLIRKLRVG